MEGSRFVRVDSDIIDNLISKGDKKANELQPAETEMLTALFKSQIPSVEKAEFMVQFESIAGSDLPVTVTQHEYMRRMKEMAAMQPGMNFYGELPDSYTLVVNLKHPLVERIKADADKAIGTKINEQFTALTGAEAALKAVHNEIKDNKPTDEQQAKTKEYEAEMAKDREEIRKTSADYAAAQPLVRQLIDLALLGSGLLKGKDLSEFVKRSVSLL